MTEGAKYARNAIPRRSPNSRLGRTILYRSIARAVWRQDVKRGSILLRSHPLARQLLGYDPDSRRLWQLDPAEFSRELDSLQTADHEANIQALARNTDDNAPEKARRKRRQLAKRFQKRAAFWAPFDRRLHLKGIRMASGGGRFSCSHAN